ncbi:MAG: hypothetical protein ACRBHB_12320 [Arenicella sp.]
MTALKGNKALPDAGSIDPGVRQGFVVFVVRFGLEVMLEHLNLVNVFLRKRTLLK